jgi:hypothetical protein
MRHPGDPLLKQPIIRLVEAHAYSRGALMDHSREVTYALLPDRMKTF